MVYRHIEEVKSDKELKISCLITNNINRCKEIKNILSRMNNKLQVIHVSELKPFIKRQKRLRKHFDKYVPKGQMAFMVTDSIDYYAPPKPYIMNKPPIYYDVRVPDLNDEELKQLKEVDQKDAVLDEVDDLTDSLCSLTLSDQVC